MQATHCLTAYDHRMPVGARRENRTPTLLRELDFESSASASSAIRAPHKVLLARRSSNMNLQGRQLRDRPFH